MTLKDWAKKTANEIMDTVNDDYLCCQIQNPEVDPEQFLNELRAYFDSLADDWKHEMLDEYYKEDAKND